MVSPRNWSKDLRINTKDLAGKIRKRTHWTEHRAVVRRAVIFPCGCILDKSCLIFQMLWHVNHAAYIALSTLAFRMHAYEQRAILTSHLFIIISVAVPKVLSWRIDLESAAFLLSTHSGNPSKAAKIPREGTWLLKLAVPYGLSLPTPLCLQPAFCLQ